MYVGILTSLFDCSWKTVKWAWLTILWFRGYICINVFNVSIKLNLVYFRAQYHKLRICLRGLYNLYTYDIPVLGPHIRSPSKKWHGPRSRPPQSMRQKEVLRRGGGHRAVAGGRPPRQEASDTAAGPYEKSILLHKQQSSVSSCLTAHFLSSLLFLVCPSARSPLTCVSLSDFTQAGAANVNQACTLLGVKSDENKWAVSSWETNVKDEYKMKWSNCLWLMQVFRRVALHSSVRSRRLWGWSVVAMWKIWPGCQWKSLKKNQRHQRNVKDVSELCCRCICWNEHGNHLHLARPLVPSEAKFSSKSSPHCKPRRGFDPWRPPPTPTGSPNVLLFQNHRLSS